MKQIPQVLLLLIALLFVNTGYGAFVITNRSQTIEIVDSVHHNQEAHAKKTLPRRDAKNGILAYLSIGCALLGLAIASPQLGAVLIILGTAAGVFGKIGLKNYRRQTFLRVLCYLGIILGAVVLALGMVPIIFLTL